MKNPKKFPVMEQVFRNMQMNFYGFKTIFRGVVKFQTLRCWRFGHQLYKIRILTNEISIKKSEKILGDNQHIQIATNEFSQVLIHFPSSCEFS